MEKQKLLARISVFCYLAMILAGVILGVVMIVAGTQLDTGNENAEFGEALGAAIGLVVVIIVAVFSFIYAALAIFPFAFQLRYLRRPRKLLPILCLVFDVIFLVFGSALFVSALTGDGLDVEGGGLILLALALLLPLATLVINILHLVARSEPPLAK